MKAREEVEKRKLEIESQKRDDEEELDKLQNGKTTLKSFFKSKTGKQEDIQLLTAAIQIANVEIEQYRQLSNFITVY